MAIQCQISIKIDEHGDFELEMKGNMKEAQIISALEMFKFHILSRSAKEAKVEFEP